MWRAELPRAAIAKGLMGLFGRHEREFGNKSVEAALLHRSTAEMLVVFAPFERHYKPAE